MVKTPTPKECYVSLSKKYARLKIACQQTLDGHQEWLDSPPFLRGAEIQQMEPMLDGLSAIQVAMGEDSE